MDARYTFLKNLNNCLTIMIFHKRVTLISITIYNICYIVYCMNNLACINIQKQTFKI